MPYKLRFVQRISQENKEKFLELEREFINFEKKFNMPQGKRYLPVSGLEPNNTLIWECEFETMELLLDQLNSIYTHPEHDRLLKLQIPFMQDSYTEIYEVFT